MRSHVGSNFFQRRPQLQKKLHGVFISTLVDGELPIDFEPTMAQLSLTLGKLVTEKPVDFVDFDNVVEFNKNRQNDDNVVKAYKS